MMKEMVEYGIRTVAESGSDLPNDYIRDFIGDRLCDEFADKLKDGSITHDDISEAADKVTAMFI